MLARGKGALAWEMSVAVTAYRSALELRPAFSLARNNLDAVQRQLDLKKAEKDRAAPTPAGK